ncbi:MULTISPECIES: hypothetical protein [unclassified Streptomyces]|uniref:hypothetical protein n=1 Tax=unclassified Streptomyces TaxID=2593676 RepID=UPI000DBA2F2C|nr:MULTISPECIES: hypothetical protein [unclassified Streptomyces]MYT73297.1 hypothetical protein [Streptomyces sp. SID8367]RAJ74897.1 hypothetical protein K377_06664 [Streptomyces sp. PsTaAH-137]
MAGVGYEIDADVLKSQGRAFARLGEDFGSAAKKSGDAIEGLEEGFGDDDAGVATTILDFYKPISAGIRDSLEHLTEALKGVGEKLDSMAEQYDTTEQDHYQALMQASQNRGA